MQTVREWYQARVNADISTVEAIPFANLTNWRIDEASGNFHHTSGQFFSVVGARCCIESAGLVQRWEQPLINQPEQGLLGLLSRTVNGTREFLMQAKMEPGNINRMQLSPTVQATRSNFMRVHAGRPTAYLEYFLPGRASQVIADSLQPEQGGRFYRKRNRNVVIEVADTIDVLETHRWVSDHELRDLLRENNVVSMNSRSVLACYLAGGNGRGGDGREDIGDVLDWIARVRVSNRCLTTVMPLNKVSGWQCGKSEICCLSKDYFSVIAVAVRSMDREVTEWTQPILKESARGFVGLLLKRLDGVTHYLVQAKVEPGNLDSVYLGPTIQCSHENIDPRLPYMAVFGNSTGVWFDAILSEEGGRFYHNQNRYVALEVGNDVEASENHKWVSYPQLLELIRRGWINVEARTVIAGTSLAMEGER